MRRQMRQAEQRVEERRGLELTARQTCVQRGRRWCRDWPRSKAGRFRGLVLGSGFASYS